MAEADRAEVERLPVTSVARTLLDLAVVVGPKRLERALDQAERLRIFDLAEVEELLERNRGHNGRSRLRRAISRYQYPEFTRSGLERDFLALIRKAGLPRPSVNTFVAGYEVDMLWEPQRLAVEIDSYEFHGTRRSFEEDRLRDEDLKTAGIDVIRVTGKRIAEDGDLLVKRLAALLKRRDSTKSKSAFDVGTSIRP